MTRKTIQLCVTLLRYDTILDLDNFQAFCANKSFFPSPLLPLYVK